MHQVDLVGFCLLGMATAITWLRRRERGMGFVAAAIVLLSAVFVLAELPALSRLTVPFAGPLALLFFMGSGYALFCYRGSVVPLRRRWYHLAAVAMLLTSCSYVAAQTLNLGHSLMTAAAVAVIAVWSGAVAEPILRFWLLARALPPIQAWRLRTLSLGFGGLVLVLLLAISAAALPAQPAAQWVSGLVVLAVVPLLYLSFSPPAWVRREWRAAEEEGLRDFMQKLLLSPELDRLGEQGLEWAARLVGGESAVVFDAMNQTVASHNLNQEGIAEIGKLVQRLEEGTSRVCVSSGERTLLVLHLPAASAAFTLVVVGGPFTPTVGVDEVRRVQQFASAFMAALDRRRLMADLKESNARLQEASHHKSLFLANMSHELRTPLNAIIGFSELLSDARPGQFDEVTRKRFLGQILSGGKHLLDLINDILDLSKVEAGQMELRLDTVSVADLIDQVSKTVEPLVAKKRIKLESDGAGAGELRADAGKLKQMLLNLVSNAIKFTPEDGQVAIHATRRAKTVELSVSDSGIGIAAADQTQIFREFHQIDSSPGRRHEGTGLGLALTKRFALLHGGDVRLESEPGRGSVFTISLPVTIAAPVPPAKPAMPVAMSSNDSGPLVLLVEDDPGAAELLTRHLSGAGYRTRVARSGIEALHMARELNPAAITLDIILPGLDGWEVMAQLKSDRTTSAIPIVVVSVVDNPELGIALGALDYMVKPVDGKQLVERLNRFASTRTNRDSSLRVLIVDDEATNRELLEKALEPAGFSVISASGGDEAIRIARDANPDIVLLDLMMPEVTGFDVVEALHSDRQTRDTPIMILTASTLSDSDKQRLNGRVSKILNRGSVGAADVIGLLRQTVASGGVH